MFRLLLRYLTNNEELVKRLSESYPIQQAARLCVTLFNRGKNIVDEHDLKNKVEPEKLKQALRKFTQDVKNEIEDIKRRKQQ